MKVKVYSGDGQTYLGEGTFVGCVPVYFFRMSDFSLCSLPNCEKPPDQELIDEVISLGGKLVEYQNNPKIEMDDGTIKYGCQVWWERIENESKN